MARPTVEPTSISLRADPGQIRSASVTITQAPTAADVTAPIANDNSLIKVKHVIAYHLVQRPFTEEEIQELPPMPPSIRENARRNGIREYQEVGRTDGSTPLAVSAGFMVQVNVECSALAQQSLDVTTASLTIEGTTWERSEVPLVFMIGQATTIPAVEPTSIRRAAEPGETLTQDLVIAEARTDAKIVAHVANGNSIIRLKQIIAFRPVRRTFTEEEIQELPPMPPSIRENARRDGYIEYQEVERTDGNTPLTVSAGFMVRAYVEFVAPEQQAPDSVAATLVIEGTTWQRVEVPLFLIIGKIRTTLSTDSLTLRQGESGELNLESASVAGPSTDVDLALGMDGEQWRVEPPTINVPQGEVVTTALKIHVDPKAPVGTFPVGLEVRSFERLQFRSLPFGLEVKGGLVTARLLQTSVVATQGDRASCQVEVMSEGGYKVIALTPSAPLAGVSMAPVTRELSYGASKTVIPVEFAIDSQAPAVTDRVMGMNWSAGDGEHAGALFPHFTINLRPESRTFQQQITTPAGTALGGWAEITIRNDGSYTFRGHMHDSGFDSYAFRVNVVVRSASGIICLAAQKSGHVAGTLGSGSRDCDWTEDGPNPLIKSNWAQLRTGTAEFSKWYEDTGALGTLEDIAMAVAEFLVVRVFVGPYVAAAIVIGSELGAATEIPFLHPTLLTGVFVAGGIILVLGPGVILPAIVAGVVAADQVKARPLRESEKQFAAKVFGDTLPVGRILITNFDRDGTAFCIPNADGSILVCMGEREEDTLKDKDCKRTLIHELTHAWQIEHRSIPAEIAWEAAINATRSEDEVYSQTPLAVDGREWDDYEVERQAQIVAWWYFAYSDDNDNLDNALALNSPAFRYIQNNIRLGQP